ncbi:MAG TPA: YceI family protein [Rhodanobacteraceae bacterium]
MKRIAIAVSVLAFALPLAAFARDWKVDPARSALTFTGTYQGEKFEGRFRRFDAKIDYDPADLAHAKFDVSVDVASVDTANTERDQALPGKDFFDTARFPRAHFVTTRFRKSTNGAVLAEGMLSLRGISKPATLTVKFAQARSGATLDVDTTLKRLDFGVGGGDWADTSMIGDEVIVRGHLVLLP